MKTYLMFGILILGALLVINVANLTAEENWTREPNMPMNKLGHTAEVINGEIYIFGWHSDDDEDPRVTVEAYSVAETAQPVNPAGKLLKTWATIKTAQ